MDRLFWIAIVVSLVVGVVMITRRRPPRPPSSSKVIRVDLDDR